MEARVQRARAAGRRIAIKPSEDNEALLECAEYREQAVEVEGYFFHGMLKTTIVPRAAARPVRRDASTCH